MQDDQTNQPMDNGSGQGDDQSDSPGFSLGTNPSQQQNDNNTYQDNNHPQDEHSNSDDQNNHYEDAHDEDSGINPGAIDDIIEDRHTTDNNFQYDDQLDQIKEDALHQLVPIIEELDQTAEEKYRTLMMLIQASDDQSLIKSAYDAANKIDDKKARAEALLNIVNEINYFSQSQNED